MVAGADLDYTIGNHEAVFKILTYKTGCIVSKEERKNIIIAGMILIF